MSSQRYIDSFPVTRPEAIVTEALSDPEKASLLISNCVIDPRNGYELHTARLVIGSVKPVRKREYRVEGSIDDEVTGERYQTVMALTFPRHGHIIDLLRSIRHSQPKVRGVADVMFPEHRLGPSIQPLDAA